MSEIKKPDRSDQRPRSGLGGTRSAVKPPQAPERVWGASDTESPEQRYKSNAETESQVRKALIQRSNGKREVVNYDDLPSIREIDPALQVLIDDYKPLDIIA